MKKIFSLIAILFVLLLGAVEVWVQSDAFTARITPLVVGPLQAILGPEARIGRVKANFLPPYLEVRDIMIPDARGNAVVEVRKIKVYLNPVPLLVKKVRLPSISVLEPRVSLERTPDGAFNITPLVEKIKANIARTAGGGPDFTLLLKTVTVRDGALRYVDDGLSTRVSITGLDIKARFNLANDHVSLVVRSSQVRVSAPAYPEMTGTLKASTEYDRGRVRLNTFELQTGDTQVSVSGALGVSPDSDLNLNGKVRSGPQSLGRLAEIFKPARKQPAPRFEASVVVTGKTSAPTLSGGLKFSSLAYRGIMLKDAALSFRYRDKTLLINGDAWKGTLDGKALVIDTIAAEVSHHEGVLDIKSAGFSAGDLAAKLRGSIDQARGIDADLEVESRGPGKTLLLLTAVPVEGDVSVKGRLTGMMKAPLLEGRLSAGPVRVRGISFDRVEGDLQYRDKAISLTSVDIRRQRSSYVFDGAVDFKGDEPAYSARLKVLSSDVVSIVALFYETLPLKLQASGELSFQGTAKNYSGTGFLAVEAGSAYGETFTHGSVSASLTTGRIAFPQVLLYKKKGTVKAAGWIGFDGTYSADFESTDIDLSSVDHLDGTTLDGSTALRIHTAGSFSAPVVSASFEVAGFTVRRTVLGALHGAAEIKDGRMNVTAGLSEDTARLSLHWLLRKPFSWTAEAKIRTDGINPLQLLGNPELAERVKVVAEGTISARGAGLDRTSVAGDAVFSHIAVVIGEYRIDSESQPGLVVDRGRLTIKSLNFLGPGTRLSVTGTTDASTVVDLTIKGTANLPLLKLLYPEIEHAAGTAEMKLTVKDDWNNPDVAGELRIRDGEIKVPDMPQKVTALKGTVSFTQGRIATESITGEMGGGVLGLSGWVQVSGTTVQDFSVKSVVDNVTVRYPEGLTSMLSGNLYYDGNAREQLLSGDILIKRAKYDKPIEWKSMLVDIRRGLYQKKKTAIGWVGETQVNVRFHGSENILFQNNLAKMPLDIDMFLRGTVNYPQILGRIEARKGSVFFRNNNFTILHASADFVDPNRMNPVLDIQAVTQVREYQIQLAVTGTADRASVTLVSDPPLADNDILSMLTLGKKSAELKGKETAIGMGEAASFATGQFQDILERRTRSLTGLDRFQIDPYVSKSDTSVPRITVGKELVQNKLYVTYSSNVGASIPEQSFRIEYLMDKHFSLVGERTDIGNIGADIKYRFEFQ